MEPKKIDIKKTIGYILAIASLCIFAFISIKTLWFSGRIVWEDEAHFWVMIKNCSIIELFKLMRIEGHMLLWYLVVMPFKFLPYPYPMQALNWLFCFGALITLWIKAPFNPLIKIGITFSPVFLQLYSIHARCYSIGIFLLFLACAYYDKKLKKPYLYFILLALAANTSILGLIGALALGLPFLYELYQKSHKDKISYKKPVTISIITALIGIMFIYQFNNYETPDHLTISTKLIALENQLGIFFGIEKINPDNIQLIWQIAGLRLFIFATMIILATRYKSIFIYFLTMSLSTMFFLNIYRPRIWHLAFFFIYFIVSYWIFLEEKPSKIAKNTLLAISIVFLICFTNLNMSPPYSYDYLSEFLIKNETLLKQGKVFVDINPINISISLPKLNENNIYLYDFQGRNLSKFEGLMIYFSPQKNTRNKTEIYNHLDENKPNYLISGFDINKIRDYKDINNKLVTEKDINGIHLYLYEILKK